MNNSFLTGSRFLKPDSILLATGHLFFLCYTIGCFVYFKERLLNNDAAYYTFHVVNYEEFFYKHQRYICYFTQWLPIFLIKIGCSLKAVLISYSAIFAFWFYGLYVLVAHLWKSPKEAIILVFSLALTMRYKHYAGHTEITFALMVASTLVAWTLLDKRRLSWFTPNVDWAIKLGFIFWLYIIHPIIIAPMMVVLSTDMLFYKKWKSKKHWLFIGILVFSFIVRFITVAKDAYESEKVGLMANAQEVLLNLESYYVYHIVKRYFEKEYHIIILLFLGILLWLCLRKRFLTATSLLIGNMFLLVLVIATHSYLRGDVYIMIDGYLGMLGMTIGYGFYLAINHFKTYSSIPLITLALIIFCTIKIQKKAAFFTNRLDQYKSTFAMYPSHNKLYAASSLHDWDELWFPYEVPVETLILTSLESPSAAKTIFIDIDNIGLDRLNPSQQQMLIFNERLSYSRLNAKYFKPKKNDFKEIYKVSWK